MIRSRSAVATTRGVTQVEEFEIPSVESHDAMMSIEIVGICGTDWHLYHDQSANTNFPLILGHECVGRIDQIGEIAAAEWGLRSGDRVGVLEVIPCGNCGPCRSTPGNKFLCLNQLRYGAISTQVAPSLWGGFGERMYLDARSIVFRIPEEISSEISSLIVPISNGIDWLQKGRPETGPKDTIVVVGPGQHGLGCVVAAKQAGASEIIVVGQSRDSNRLEVARTLGANHTIRADFEDPVLRVRDLTSDLLADTVLNVTDNSPESFLTSINMARRGGTVVMSGYSHSVLNNFYPDIVIEKALSIKGVRGRELRSVNEALSLMKENRFPLGLLCSHKFSLEETDLALRTFARQNTDNSIHVSIVPKN